MFCKIYFEDLNCEATCLKNFPDPIFSKNIETKYVYF